MGGRILHTAAAAAALLLVATAGQAAVTFTEDFNDGVLDPALTVTVTPGMSFGIVSGEAVFTKAAGVGIGAVGRVSTGFSVQGNFTATITADRTNHGTASSGIATSHSAGFTDIYFVAGNSIFANIFVPTVSGGFGSQNVSTPDDLADFRIRRVGQTIFEEYDLEQDGSFVALHQATGSILAGDVRISFFMAQELAGTALATMEFDNFRIVADAFLFPAAAPEPGTLFLLGLGFIGMAAFRSSKTSRRSEPSRA